MNKRIAILGPESTGKSWLVEKLAKYYDTDYIPEFSREYFSNKEYKYDIDDIVNIAEGQLLIEKNGNSLNKQILFCDTEFITLKVWSEVVFGKTPVFIEELVKNHKYDLYLLCNLDVDWKLDPLRKNSHNRQYIFELFVNELKKHAYDYKIVSGIEQQRFKNAVSFVDELINDID